MSAAPLQCPCYLFFSTDTPNNYKSTVFPKHALNQFRCSSSSSSFDNRWTVDCVTDNNPIHIILKPPNSSMSMASSSSTTTLKRSKKVCLFYCAEMKALADRIAAESDTIELRSITWRYIYLNSPCLLQYICVCEMAVDSIIGSCGVYQR